MRRIGLFFFLPLAAASAALSAPMPSVPAIPLGMNPPDAWIDEVADYPAASVRNEEMGIAQVRLFVSAAGRPTACLIRASSGSDILDRATCRMLMSRARFQPVRTGRLAYYDHRTVWDLDRVERPQRPALGPPIE